MSEFLQNFHFLRPLVLILMLLPLIAYWFWRSRINTVSSWENVCDKHLLDFLLVKGSSTHRRIVSYLCVIGFIVSVISAAGPCWKKKEAESLFAENPLMIVLNLSSDMAVPDIKPNRLHRAGYAISDLLSEVKEGQKGLIVYAGEPFLITPVTDDEQIILNLLPSIDFSIMPENGDRLDLAIRLAAEKLRNGGWTHGSIIVFAPEAGQDFSRAVRAAENAAALGYTIDVVSVNTTDNDKLRKIAELGKGTYVTVNQVSLLSQKINARTSAEMQKSQNKISQWLDYGWYLVFIPLLCCSYMFRRGILVVFFILVWSIPAQAGFFLNADQEGLKAFSEDDYQTAAKNFKDKNWQGASFYRLGDYEKAYKQFLDSNNENGLYNQGNALAKMGKIEDAIAKYEQVLELNPDNEDARFNLEYLKQQQNQQQSSPQSNDENQDNEQQQDKQQGASPQNSDNNNSEDSEPENGDSDNNDDKQSSQSQQNGENSEQPQEENKEPAPAEQQEASEEREEQNKPQENQGNALQNNSGEDIYNEEVQARELQYREIPEDTGGLLRSFIAREYAKKRYEKDK